MRYVKAVLKFIILLGAEGLFAYILLITIFNQEVNEVTWAQPYVRQMANDALFVVGALMFSVGLITFTNAGKVFYGFRFAAKQMFSRKNLTHLAFHDYRRELEKKRDEKVTGLYPLLTGLILIIVSASIGAMYFS